MMKYKGQYVPLTTYVEVNPLVSITHLASDDFVSFIPMSDVTESGQWLHRQERTLHEILRQGYTPFQEGDVLFAKITPCMENGKGAHATGLVNGVGFGTTEFHVLRAKLTADARFIYHWLHSEQLRLKAEALMTGSAGQRRVNPEFFAAYHIPLFSLSEQRRIAKILDTMDNELQKTVEVIEKLKQVRLGLMQDLLTRGIDERGEVRDPVARPELFKEMQGNIQAQIPKEWEVYHLATIAKVESGVTLGRNLSGPNTVELPYLRVANVQDGYLDLTEVKTVRVFKDEVPQFLLQPGDVLMTEGGDFDKLGRGAVWKGQISPCLHQNHIFRVRVDSRYLLPDFLAQVARSSYGKSFFVLCSKQSTNLASINSTQLKSFPVPCPSIQEQERILAILYTHDAQVQKEEARLNKLQHIKKGLMEDLLTGRVRVKGDEMAREGVGVGCEV